MIIKILEGVAAIYVVSWIGFGAVVVTSIIGDRRQARRTVQSTRQSKPALEHTPDHEVTRAQENSVDARVRQ